MIHSSVLNLSYEVYILTYNQQLYYHGYKNTTS